MPLLESLFPQVEFTNAELHEIGVAFNVPAVKKYLKNEIASSLKAIATGLPEKGESDTAYLRRQAVVAGGLSVLEALHSIENPSQSV